MSSRLLQLVFAFGVVLMVNAQCDMYKGVASLIQSCTSLRECPSGWRFYEQTQSCYLVVREALMWDVARSRCQAQGADVTSLNTKAEMGFVWDLVSEGGYERYYIGLTREGADQWRWLDGTELSVPNTGFWSPGEPNNHLGIENVAVIYPTGLANDAPLASNDYLNAVVCEKKLYE